MADRRRDLSLIHWRAFASVHRDFKSICAYCAVLGSSISWKTKMQTAVSRSSAEAELCALACVTAEVTWLRWLLADFGAALSSSAPIHCNNQFCLGSGEASTHQTHWHQLLLHSVRNSRFAYQRSYSCPTWFSSLQTECYRSTMSLRVGFLIT
ncbi:hypothetical protein U9M48_013467 [Paspalum notatum var. saurae]|uniref:Uncharacterized protein n=1 Tax=Paspalum notatum var. saurae TaxID=547442 RepID=A0AAQ3T000_PASNO